ncbi:branched-chain amino acid ABC transporter permease [Rhodobacteraceae bacterium Araon29]
METATVVILSGLTLGGMYALSAIGLSLIWGALGMLNMAHGALLALGGYICFAIITQLDIPSFLAIPLAMAVTGAIGFLVYICVIKHMFRHPSFETNIIIATIGLAILSENVILKFFGAYPFRQPLSFEGGFRIGEIYVPHQNLTILATSVVLVAAVGLILGKTRMGRAIRATAINKDAALLMGVPVGRVFAQVLIISGALAAISGVMLSSITTLSPTMGDAPMIKAFIIVALAGLGNVYGAFYVAVGLGLLEAYIQFTLGVRFAFPILLLLVIFALIWRPYGIFGKKPVTRV